MFLKSLEIFGFKSFADRTRIEFSDGITALLGPNGCGKSNVVDAIKWVLGEQTSKSLRAEKMEDVIFNGTEHRKPLNVAEVTITLANETGVLPLDVPEIQIKRRLYRSGESEYYINSAPVKLKDIRELFWDTGVGKAAYSVMEQGKIDQILSSKPEERRYLFEEAAGITRYKVRGAEAERKLEKTEENMRQVEGILGEVKRSYDTLKVQAEKTLLYRKLKEEIFQYELDIQLLRLRQFINERESKKEAVTETTRQRDALQAELDAINRALEENMDMVNSMEAQLVQHQKELYGLAVEKNAKEKEARLLAEQRQQIIAKITQNEGRERAIQLKIEELSDDAQEQDGVVRDLRKRLEEIEKNIAAFEENIQLASHQIGENEEAVRRSQEAIRSHEEERLRLEQDLTALTDDIVRALDEGLKGAGYSVAERRRLEEALEGTLKRLKTHIEGKKHIFQDMVRMLTGYSQGTLSLSPQDGAAIAKTLEGASTDTEQAVADLIQLFDAYKRLTPTFIDDFLAPEGIITRKRQLDEKIGILKSRIQDLQKKIEELRKENDGLGLKIEEYRKTLEELRLSRVRMSTQAQAAEEQARLIRRELAGQEGLLKTVQDELFLDRKRRDEILEQLENVEADIADIERRGRTLAEELDALEKDIARRNGDVAGKQELIKKKVAEKGKIQQNLEKHHLELAQLETEIKNLLDNFRETHSRDLLEFEERMYTITAPQAELREKLAGARNALKELGQVNLMAPEEFQEVKERYDFLSNQLADLARAREDLERITAEIRSESSELFLATYNRIKKNFHNMFRRLFGGGRAELRLSDPHHVLQSGIEIYAQPPGKKLENINLLSGGEKSMTAVALLFATYMVKPSPFCFLDEIDAALDEQNVTRFVQLLKEFGSTSQFIVITHNKKTVTGANTLLGVTMEESGVTKVISVRLENEEARHHPRETFEETESFEEEEVEEEVGMELPPGIDDPSQVREEDLRPIRASRNTVAENEGR